jgi:Tfp pilus assembly protein PilX
VRQRLVNDERGSALLTALMAVTVTIVLGLGLLAIADTQAGQSGAERTRDRAFNLAESVLNSEAFVLGHSWPSSASLSPVGTSITPSERNCSDALAGFGATLGTAATTGTATARLQPNLNASYTDAAYTGGSWQVNVCDDNGSSTVWDDSLLTNGTKNWDTNANNRVWVRAQGTVDGKTRAIAGLVQVHTQPAFRSKYGLTTGGLADDLGATINTLGANVAGGVLSGLLGVTPTVARDPLVTATTPPNSGVTGLRCGALDMADGSTCVTGTIAALSGASGLPVINSLVTGGTIEQVPTLTAASADSIAQLRSQAIQGNTYQATSSGCTGSAGGSPCAAAPPACTIPAAASASTVVFIEKVGGGDDYCMLSLATGKRYKALIVGSGRVILRGNGTVSSPASTDCPGVPVATVPANIFCGNIYALNLQRNAVADGGLGLGDAAAPGRDVVRIDNGAHVKGSVNADGKSARVSIIPPALTLDTNALIVTLVPCTNLVTCLLQTTIKALSGVTAIVDSLLNAVGIDKLLTGILGQLNPQRASYGSAITSDVAAVNNVTVYGASGLLPGTFKDLQPPG